jgi:hypothetical protein
VNRIPIVPGVLHECPIALVDHVAGVPPHEPATHVSPVPQIIPHAPQFDGSVCVLTHVPPHDICPAGHPHTPALHTCVGGHTVLQPPQCIRSVCVFTHAPEHDVSPVLHAHTPATHDMLIAHAVPHVPQLAASVWRSVHTSLHAVEPEAHGGATTAKLQPQFPYALLVMPWCMLPTYDD